MLIVCALATILAGAALQRLTGMGFALVAAPFLVLALGPFEGVLVANVCSVVSAGLLFSLTWRGIDVRRLSRLLPAAIVGVVPGVLVAACVDVSVLDLLIGIVVVAGVTVSVVVGRWGRADGTGVMIGFGLASGFMNVTAGVGGPALSAYAVLARWPQDSLRATLQPIFFTTGLVSVAAKSVVGPPLGQVAPPWLWVVMVAAILLGIRAGSALEALIPARSPRIALIVLAYLGSVIILVRGTLGVDGP